MMLAAMFFFAAADTHAKVLTEFFHPVQIIWFRQLGLSLGVIVLLVHFGPTLLRTRQPGLQVTRGALAVFSSVLFVFAVKHVALADAVAASFVAPFFVTILGVVWLGEKVGYRRWSAVVVGFIGALIVVRPGMGVIHPAVMLVVVAAGIYAARQVVGRLLADTDNALTTICYTALISSLLISIPLPLVWQTPDLTWHWIALASMSILAGAGEVMVIKSLEAAEAAVVAPIHYTMIVWGTMYGFLIFNDLPDQWTLLGAAIIIGAGLYTFRRDKLQSSMSDD